MTTKKTMNPRSLPSSKHRYHMRNQESQSISQRQPQSNHPLHITNSKGSVNRRKGCERFDLEKLLRVSLCELRLDLFHNNVRVSAGT
jgi:hypothetical protein